jgi:hypothetical protein
MNTKEPNSTNHEAPNPGESDSIREYLKSPQFKARNDFANQTIGLPDLGIRKLSLTQAADLVAADMWLYGEDKVEIPGTENDWLERNDPRLMELLAPKRLLLLERLIESISNGSLKLVKVLRDLATGAIDPGDTFVDYDDLCNWMQGFGCEPNDWMAEYVDDEAEIYNDLVEALFDIRNIRFRSSHIDLETLKVRQRIFSHAHLDAVPGQETRTTLELREIIKGYAEEVAHLRRELQERPPAEHTEAINPKSRSTLYRLILALCVAAKINPTARGAAATLAALTEKVGVPVGDDTIRKILDELPEIDSG